MLHRIAVAESAPRGEAPAEPPTAVTVAIRLRDYRMRGREGFD